MSSEVDQLHFLFFPLMAQGHMIPTVDTARLFAVRGMKVTILLTPRNTPRFSDAIERDKHLGMKISLHPIKFPSLEVGLPEGTESPDSISSPEMAAKFIKAMDLLQQPFEQLLREHRPDCVIADMFFPWATDVAAKLRIPRIVFHLTSIFYLCVADSLKRYKPHENIDDQETFVVPGLPDHIEMTKSRMAHDMRDPNEKDTWLDKIIESEIRSYGAMVNSFYEMEPAYMVHYKRAMGRKLWHIGPVSLLSNRDITDKAQRGDKASIDQHECLRWLDSKKPNSVLYVCFGSVFGFSGSQLLEIAMGLEASGCEFIWAVRRANGEEEKCLLDGFEERMEGKGLIVRGWVPQVLILDHPAIGGFLTHCGWNSILESVSAGVAMITWPLYAEQFFNENLLVKVLGIGVGVGCQEWSSWEVERKVLVKREEIKNAVTKLMGDGKEAEQMRNRAKELKEMTRRDVEEGGSSYANLTALINEFSMLKRQTMEQTL